MKGLAVRRRPVLGHGWSGTYRGRKRSADHHRHGRRDDVRLGMMDDAASVFLATIANGPDTAAQQDAACESRHPVKDDSISVSMIRIVHSVISWWCHCRGYCINTIQKKIQQSENRNQKTFTDFVKIWNWGKVCEEKIWWKIRFAIIKVNEDKRYKLDKSSNRQKNWKRNKTDAKNVL